VRVLRKKAFIGTASREELDSLYGPLNSYGRIEAE
jgi:hypothetical protein